MAPRHPSRPLPDPGLRNILADLRRRITHGRLAAGARLPPVRELAEGYGVAVTTVHRCLQELAAAGFVSTHGRNGTRVVDHPPHRCRFGLVLPVLPGADGVYGERHWQAKALAAATLSSGPERQIEIFHGINGHPELPEHQRLLAALAAHRLAGLILLDEGRVRDWLMPARLGLPVVGVEPARGHPAIGQLRLDLAAFLARALETVAQQGRRRVAVLLDVGALHCLPAMITHAVSLGLDLPSRLIQCLPVSTPEWARQIVAGLMHGPPRQRPEALILADEGVIPAVDDALDAEGVGELLQIHIANLPLPALARRPALRLGWDHQHYLLRAIDLIEAWHGGRRPIGDQRLPLTDVTG